MNKLAKYIAVNGLLTLGTFIITTKMIKDQNTKIFILEKELEDTLSKGE